MEGQASHIREDYLNSISPGKTGSPYGASYKLQERNALGKF